MDSQLLSVRPCNHKAAKYAPTYFPSMIVRIKILTSAVQRCLYRYSPIQSFNKPFLSQPSDKCQLQTVSLLPATRCLTSCPILSPLPICYLF